MLKQRKQCQVYCVIQQIERFQLLRRSIIPYWKQILSSNNIWWRWIPSRQRHYVRPVISCHPIRRQNIQNCLKMWKAFNQNSFLIQLIVVYFAKISSIRNGYSKTSNSTVLTWRTNKMLHAVILSTLFMIGAIRTPFVANNIQLSSVKPVNKINQIRRPKSTRMLALNFQHDIFQ